MADISMIDNPILSGVGTAPQRRAQPLNRLRLPPDLALVSADDHWEVTEDIFYEQLPAHLKEIGPRVWFNKVWWTMPSADRERGAIPASIDDYTMNLVNNLANVRGYSRASRAEDIAIEGHRKSIVFPNTILAMLHHSNLELREQVFRIYNRYIAEESKGQSDFFGVAIFPNWWDQAKAVEQIKEIADLGLKTVSAQPGTRAVCPRRVLRMAA